MFFTIATKQIIFYLINIKVKKVSYYHLTLIFCLELRKVAQNGLKLEYSFDALMQINDSRRHSRGISCLLRFPHLNLQAIHQIGVETKKEKLVQVSFSVKRRPPSLVNRTPREH
jgi:hypothetical protein